MKIFNLPRSRRYCWPPNVTQQVNISGEGIPVGLPSRTLRHMIAPVTDVTPTALTSDGTAANAENQIAVPLFSEIAGEGLFVVRNASAIPVTYMTWRVTWGAHRENAASSTGIDFSTVAALGPNPGAIPAPVVQADTTLGVVKIIFTGTIGGDPGFPLFSRYTFYATTTQ